MFNGTSTLEMSYSAKEVEMKCAFESTPPEKKTMFKRRLSPSRNFKVYLVKNSQNSPNI